MRTTLRTVTALALAVPLIASTLPASASSTSLYREKGAFAEAYFEGAGTPGGLPGNYSFGWLSFHSSDLADGFVETFDCDAGETPFGDETGENACDSAGSYYGWGEGLTVATGKGKGASSTFSGSIDLFDAMTEEGALAAEDVPFTVTLTPTGARTSRPSPTPTGTPSPGSPTGLVRPASTTTPRSPAASTGSPAVGGTVGTYSVRFMERIA